MSKKPPKLLPAAVAQKTKHSKAKTAPKGVNWSLAKSWYAHGWEGVDADGLPALVYPTIGEIATKLGVQLQTAQARSAAEGWVEARLAAKEALFQKQQEALLRDLVDARVRIRTKALKGAELVLDRVVDAVGAIPEGKDAIVGAKALPGLALAARQAQQTAHVAVGLPKDGVMAGTGTSGAAVTLWTRLRGARATVGVAVQVQVSGPEETETVADLEGEVITA